MLLEDISTSQILTATLFIAALIAVQIYIIKNKNSIKQKWAPNKRIQILESTRLGPTERLQIIKVDNIEFLYFFTKGSKPFVVQLTSKDNLSQKQISKVTPQAQSSSKPKTNSTKNQVRIGTNELVQTDSKIIQAISLARKQNPKVSFE